MTKRIPSAEAISAPPQAWASGSRVVIDQPGVRGGVGGRAQVIVGYPVEPLALQRRVALVGDRGEPDGA